MDGLNDMSRAPTISPHRTSREIEAAVLTLRDENPKWGGRKLRRRLVELGRSSPSASTITNILRRNNRLDREECAKHGPCRRFEHEKPNDLWQMDFKGDFSMTGGGRCHPLTIVDDHSRFCVCINACENERLETVRAALTNVFRRYGVPEYMLMDNGSCWGGDAIHRYTPLSAWLIRLGVGVRHGRPYHPQTQGKNERFNRTLKAEAIGTRRFSDLAQCQQRFDKWRDVYNFDRPHEALDMQTPSKRYRPSSHEFPESLPAIEYGAGDMVRKVQKNGYMLFHSVNYFVGHAFAGYPLAIRPTTGAGIYKVYFCHQCIGTINRREESFSRGVHITI